MTPTTAADISIAARQAALHPDERDSDDGVGSIRDVGSVVTIGLVVVGVALFGDGEGFLDGLFDGVGLDVGGVVSSKSGSS